MKKILVVEDDKSILMALSVRLRGAGYTVATAQDAMMAMSVAVKELPDLVILDISMPAGNGFQVAERLQDNCKTVGTPFIFLTASRKPGLRDKAMQMGAQGFFEKPYDPTELMAAVSLALGEERGEAA